MTEIDKPTVFTLSLIALAQVVTFILKATGAIDWSWLWVLAPLWVPYALVLFGGSMIVVYLAVYNIKERCIRKRGGSLFHGRTES